MLKINNNLTLSRHELEITATRSQGAGGQNVNKVSTAIHLRFDIKASSLPESYKERLLATKDSRLTNDFEMVIKAQNYRSQEKNLKEALERLKKWILENTKVQKKRRATRPKKSSIEKRLQSKKQRGALKSNRKNNWDD